MLPRVWKVMAHGSASVAFSDYRSLLMFRRPRLAADAVCLLADRGFVHRELMAWVRQTRRWHCRIRYHSGIGLYRWDGGRFVPWRWPVDPGRVVCYHSVDVTGGRDKVPLAVGWQAGAEAPWARLSDAPTAPETLYEYGLRCNLEEGFLDQQSNGFRWASSTLRDRHALQRWCFVMAVATLIWIGQGTTVVAEGNRRVVDPHGFRGHRYARIGWDWIRHALARGTALMLRLTLDPADDPERARASKRQPDRSRWVDALPWKYCLLRPAPEMATRMA
jgi:hypothetical protein